MHKKTGRIRIQPVSFYTFFLKLSRIYFISRLMSLLTFTASATHTATTNVTNNNAVIIFSFL